MSPSSTVNVTTIVTPQQYPVDESADVTLPLTEEELLDVDVQAAQLVADAKGKLVAFKHLAQNFPRVPIGPEVLEEQAANQPRARGSVNLARLNGVLLEEKDLNPFGLLRLIRRERGSMLGLTSLGLLSEQALQLLTHSAIARAQSAGSSLDGLFDASDRAEGGG